MGAKVQKRCEKRKVKRELFAYPLHFLFLFHNSLVVWEIGRLVVWEIGRLGVLFLQGLQDLRTFSLLTIDR